MNDRDDLCLDTFRKAIDEEDVRETAQFSLVELRLRGCLRVRRDARESVRRFAPAVPRKCEIALGEDYPEEYRQIADLDSSPPLTPTGTGKTAGEDTAKAEEIRKQLEAEMKRL